jgi:hypothetical protein
MAELCRICQLPEALHVDYIWHGQASLRCPTSAEQELICICGHPARLHLDQLAYTRCISSCGCAGFTIVPRCDFCSQLGAIWEYPTKEVSLQYMLVSEQDGQLRSRSTPEHVSKPGWAACETCSGLIEQGMRAALTGRAPVNWSLVPPGRKREFLQMMRDFHAQTFWNVRSGPRRRLVR